MVGSSAVVRWVAAERAPGSACRTMGSCRRVPALPRVPAGREVAHGCRLHRGA
jgi:hypothetical protein